MNAISLFLSILVFATQQTGDRCICKGEEISLGEIHRSYKTQYGDSKGHGFIKDMEFDSVGILSVSCLLETHFPIMDMEKNPPLKIDTIGGRLNYQGYLVEQPEYVWRENVLRGHLSVLYVVKDEYREEFDAILDSISITMVANKE